MQYCNATSLVSRALLRLGCDYGRDDVGERGRLGWASRTRSWPAIDAVPCPVAVVRSCKTVPVLICSTTSRAISVVMLCATQLGRWLTVSKFIYTHGLTDITIWSSYTSPFRFILMYTCHGITMPVLPSSLFSHVCTFIGYMVRSCFT